MTRLRILTEEPRYDFDIPEDVIFKVIPVGEEWTIQDRGWDGYSVECAYPLPRERPAGALLGAVEYEHETGCGLDHVIYEITPCPRLFGWYVHEGITAVYSRGRWDFGEDDDMMFYPGSRVRRATWAEIRDHAEPRHWFKVVFPAWLCMRIMKPRLGRPE